MNKSILSGLATLALLMTALPAAAQTVEFTLTNDSTQALHFFYTSPSNENDWGDDLLGDTGTLEAGMEGTVTIGDGSDQCLYDFKFITGEGNELIVNEIDICTLASYTLSE
ncbi:hypothetical protein VW29_20885 [Devosia limi DSM 17137]|uniref:Argininosuccinate lyase n=1 Tax=Devosia limi DSM 17137 TaxID=1121477 RepID=A0A0F5L1G3_9HYPH|nr:hypothetical protein [Devosia limi]KKB76203.1 hypothetical protein VW29_20885 [Devosia limi DSM 17137]SHF19354.1 hypothetical protein SAMN02745223_02010 [Devosia limi DSM 17137]